MSYLSPFTALEKAANEKSIPSFDLFLEWLRKQWKNGSYKNDEAKNWTKYSDIPIKECRKLIQILLNS
jgi:hypothetical protein